MYLPGHGCFLTSRADGAVEAFEARDGTSRWSYRPPRVHSELGAYPQTYPSCPPQTTTDGAVLLPFSKSLAMIEVADGAVRFVERYPVPQRWSLCPVVTSDSGVVYVTFSPGGDSVLTKLDATGETVWQLPLRSDLVGPVVGALSTVDETGEIIARTPRHVVNVNPAGEVNWVREIEAPPP